MRLIGDNIGIQYDKKHNKVVKIGDIELIIQHEWDDNQTDDGYTRTNGNVNLLEVVPQIATVVAPNDKFPYKEGDKVFLHYMAHEWKEPLNYGGMDFDVVDANYIFFKIVDEQIVLADDHYLGERVFEKEQIRPSGIIININEKPVASHIKITHVPQNSSKSYIKEGFQAITCDDKQYEFTYKEKKYVKLVADEIVGQLL